VLKASPAAFRSKGLLRAHHDGGTDDIGGSFLASGPSSGHDHSVRFE
jgi:hypothetical protein